ncbi:hypothetical protein [Psychrobacillus glaciei]|nr:hypothetical protein [Psychrobacillus glaciei]
MEFITWLALGFGFSSAFYVDKVRKKNKELEDRIKAIEKKVLL